MRFIWALLCSSVLTTTLAFSAEKEGKYHSDKEYRHLVEGGYLERNSFYPDGNSGQLQLLVMSVDRGDEPVLEKLLDAAPDFVNCNEGFSGCGPLHWAAFKGDTNILRILLKRGAKVSRKGTNWEITALHIARDCKTAEYLIAQGADIEARSQSGRTPLMYAASNGNFELVECLLEHGAKLEATDQEKHTALYIADAYSRTNIVNLLLAKGASPLRPGEHEFPYEIAAGSWLRGDPDFPFYQEVLVNGNAGNGKAAPNHK